MSYYVKLTDLSIKAISRSITLFRFADISSLVKHAILNLRSIFNIGYKLNG